MTKIKCVASECKNIKDGICQLEEIETEYDMTSPEACFCIVKCINYEE